VKQSTHRMGSEQSHYPQHQEKHRQGPQHCATSLSRRDTLPWPQNRRPRLGIRRQRRHDCAEQRLSVTTLFCSNFLLDREGLAQHWQDRSLGRPRLVLSGSSCVIAAPILGRSGRGERRHEPPGSSAARYGEPISRGWVVDDTRTVSPWVATSNRASESKSR